MENLALENPYIILKSNKPLKHSSMKITPTRISARTIIVLQSICIVLSPFALIGFTQLFWWNNISIVKMIPLWLSWVILLSQPVVAVLLVIYRLHKDHDGKLLKKWQAKREQKACLRKEKIHEAITKIQQNGYYSIQEVLPQAGQAFQFRITFSNDLLKKQCQ